MLAGTFLLTAQVLSLPSILTDDIKRTPLEEACRLWSTTKALAANVDTGSATLPFQALYEGVAEALGYADVARPRLEMLSALRAFLHTLAADAMSGTSDGDANHTLLLDRCEKQLDTAEEAAQRYRRAHEKLAMYVKKTQAEGRADIDMTLVATRDAAFAEFEKSLAMAASLQASLDLDAIWRRAACRLSQLDDAAAVLTAFANIEPRALRMTKVDIGAIANFSSACVTALTSIDVFVKNMHECASDLENICGGMIEHTIERNDGAMVSSLTEVQVLLHNLLSLQAPGGQSFASIVAEVPIEAMLTAYIEQRRPLAKIDDQLITVATRMAAMTELSESVQRAVSMKDSVVTRFTDAHKTVKKARKLYLEAKAAEDSSDEEEINGATAVLAERRSSCRLAARSRDAAARSLFAHARAFFPEVLLEHGRRLGMNAAVAAWSERRLDDYENRSPLARAEGGRHLILKASYGGQPCVLKDLPLDFAKQMCKEVDVLRRLNHPSIIQLEAVFSENDHLYMHLPFAQHGDLEHFLERQASLSNDSARMPAVVLCKMARQLCEALAYLAERGVVHCDVKPANIFVDGPADKAELQAILGDFDVSHTASGRTLTLTMALQTRGIATHYSEEFAAPEVVCAPQGSSPRAMHKLDVFGLGCVLFHMHMYPRALRAPRSLEDEVAGNGAQFEDAGDPTPACAAWASAVPQDLIQAATRANASVRCTARELLQTEYMRRAEGEYARVAVQRPAYWDNQEHAGSWLVQECDAVRVAVEALMNRTSKPNSHGGRQGSFASFKVTAVHRVENSRVWSAYASQRRAIGDTLAAEGYTMPEKARRLDTSDFSYPLDCDSLDAAAGERLLFHGTGFAKSITSAGFDVRYAFAGTGAGAAFGRGVYFAESSSKADQYAVANSDGKLYMFVSRVCLGRCRVVRRARAAAPFLPEVAGVSTSEVPVYYDSILADKPGRPFREIVVGKDSNAYPRVAGGV